MSIVQNPQTHYGIVCAFELPQTLFLLYSSETLGIVLEVFFTFSRSHHCYTFNIIGFAFAMASASFTFVFPLMSNFSFIAVTSVRSARQVIDALNAEGHDIDIILLEVDLPLKKGLKLLKYIMRDRDLQRIPVISKIVSFLQGSN